MTQLNWHLSKAPLAESSGPDTRNLTNAGSLAIAGVQAGVEKSGSSAFPK